MTDARSHLEDLCWVAHQTHGDGCQTVADAIDRASAVLAGPPPEPVNDTTAEVNRLTRALAAAEAYGEAKRLHGLKLEGEVERLMALIKKKEKDA